MTSPEKRKGDDFERAIHSYLQARGMEVWRPKAGYPRDIGDVLLMEHGITLQAKAYKNLTEGLNQGIRGAQLQAVEATEDLPLSPWPYIGVTVVKRRQRPVSEALVALPLKDFVELLHRIDGLREIDS